MSTVRGIRFNTDEICVINEVVKRAKRRLAEETPYKTYKLGTKIYDKLEKALRTEKESNLDKIAKKILAENEDYQGWVKRTRELDALRPKADQHWKWLLHTYWDSSPNKEYIPEPEKGSYHPEAYDEYHLKLRELCTDSKRRVSKNYRELDKARESLRNMFDEAQEWRYGK